MERNEFPTGYKTKLFSYEGNQAGEQTAQGGCVVSVPGRPDLTRPDLSNLS